MPKRSEGQKSWKRQTKHCCAICSDKASGKHYGVYSCEGCKGFFKRTIRKDMQYKCKETSNCLIDKRHRNRCQSCRFEKCMEMGMRKEAVQEERNTTPPTVAEVITVPMPPLIDTKASTSECGEDEVNTDDTESVRGASRNHCRQRLFDFATQIPAFRQLSNHDQSVLIYNAYCELIICDLALDLYVDADQCSAKNYSSGFYKKLCVFADKLGDLSIDKMMMGAIKLIFLLDHEAPNMKNHRSVEEKREKVYNCLLEHCIAESPKDPGLFTQLLLRISTIRSLACEHEDDIYMLCGKPTLEDCARSCNSAYKSQS